METVTVLMTAEQRTDIVDLLAGFERMEWVVAGALAAGDEGDGWTEQQKRADLDAEQAKAAAAKSALRILLGDDAVRSLADAATVEHQVGLAEEAAYVAGSEGKPAPRSRGHVIAGDEDAPDAEVEARIAAAYRDGLSDRVPA